MKGFYLLAFFIVAAQCGHLRIPRDVSELLYSNPGAYHPQQGPQTGYDYPRPGISTRPVFKDPEPVVIQTRPFNPEPYPVQTRPIYPTIVQRPVYPRPDQNYLPSRPVYRPEDNSDGYNYPNPYATETFDNRVQPTAPSSKILWPLFNKIAGVISGNNGQQYPGYPGYPGTNSIGYPGGINNQYPGNYPGNNYPSKFPILNSLFPNYNYQRIEAVPSPAPISVQIGSDSGYFGSSDTRQSGVNSIGDSVVVDAVPSPAPVSPAAPLPEIPGGGYDYPNPNELRPPLELPDGLQFKVLPKNE